MSLTSAQNGGGVHNDAVPSNIETGTPHDKPGLCANKTLVVIFGAICVAVALAVAVGVGVGVTQRKTTEAPKLTTSVAAVEAAIKLPYTKSDFTAEKQDSFRKAMAKAAVTSVGDVKIKSITEVPSRRSSSDSSWIDRRAGGGFIRVDFSVALASADAATEILSAMSSDNINKALVREGLPEGVIVSKPQIKFLDSQSEAQAASPPPQAPPSPPAPPASRRAAFVPFESCEAIAVSFGGASVAADSQLKEQLAVDEPFYDFPEDYCDTCNCSLKKPAEQEQVFKSGVVMTTMSPTAPQTDAAQASTAKSSAAADSSAGASTAESAQDFTGTNNQVEGVDEADSIKNDGEYLYMLGVGGSRRVDWQQGKTLIIAKAFPADTAHVVSTTDLSIYSFTPTMLLLTDDALVVMGTSYVSNSDDSYSFSTTVTQLWDVSNRAAPELRKTVQVEGNLLSARMVERRVYVVTETYPSWIPRVGKKDAKTLRNVAPLFREIPATADMSPAVAGKGEQRAQVPFRPIVANCKSILQMTGLGDATSFVSVFVLDSDVQRPTYGSWKVAAYTGRGGTVYVSTERIYVASSTYEYPRPEPVPFQVDTACDAAGCSETPARTACKDGEIEQKGACTPQQDPPKPRLGVWSAILRFEMNKGEPAFGGLAEVEGSIINQFAMDEHDGHLRVATTRGEMWAVPSTSESAITILNNELAVVGLLSGLAPGERIYSVRFMQERGYVVTYRQVDPFFVFDLAKPSAPRVLGELKIPGFSDYLHPLSATHMLGVGKETYEIKNDGGSGTRVVMGGVKLSLFNVKNPSLPTEDSKLLIGDAGTSTEVSYQHKAFLYHAASGYIALPVDLHQQAGCKDISQGDACMTPDFLNMWGPSTFQGAYVVKIDNVPDQTGISKKELRVHMRISHERPKTGTGIEGQSGKMAWGLSWNWRQSLRRIYRSIYMDGLLYTLSDRNMQAHHLETKALKASLNLTQPTCYAPEAYRDQGGMFSIGIVGRPMAMP